MTLDHDADTFEKVKEYIHNRGVQLQHEGVVFSCIEEVVGGVTAIATYKNKQHIMFFVYPSHRSKGLYKKVVLAKNLPVLTVNDCRIVNYLEKNNIPHVVVGSILDSKEYKLIFDFYGSRIARRAKIPLMNHIHEGLTILSEIGASEEAKRAFCIHPIVQSDEDLANNFHQIKGLDPVVVALAFEYRSVANEYLSHRTISTLSDIRLSPLKDVNDMLIADKIQNNKDFLLYHKATHVRSKELEQYFQNWFARLGLPSETTLK